MGISGRTLLLVVAAIIASFAAITVRNRLMQTPVVEAGAPAVAAPRILIAKHDLILGSFVQAAQDLDWAPAPPATAPKPAAAGEAQNETTASHDSYLYEGAVKITDFNGAVVRRSIKMGDPIPQTALMKSGEGGFMSAVLENGMRAVSIAVTATSGNAGFVSPGDHVDLIVTHRTKTLQGSSISDEIVVSETFTHDVRVVAVDQMLDNPENKAILAKTITVEVTPRQAEQIAVAAEMGKISIALRSLPATADKKAVTEEKTDAAAPLDENAHALVDLYDAQAQAAGAHDIDPSQLSGHRSDLVPRVLIIRGDKSENVDFYQGKQ